LCSNFDHLPEHIRPGIECFDEPNLPEINPGGPFEPLDGNTGPKRRSIMDWFKRKN
jgi:hypothetical protein